MYTFDIIIYDNFKIRENVLQAHHFAQATSMYLFYDSNYSIQLVCYIYLK